jgi:hypothetical protein
MMMLRLLLVLGQLGVVRAVVVLAVVVLRMLALVRADPAARLRHVRRGHCCYGVGERAV